MPKVLKEGPNYRPGGLGLGASSWFSHVPVAARTIPKREKVETPDADEIQMQAGGN